MAVSLVPQAVEGHANRGTTGLKELQDPEYKNIDKGFRTIQPGQMARLLASTHTCNT